MKRKNPSSATGPKTPSPERVEPEIEPIPNAYEIARAAALRHEAEKPEKARIAKEFAEVKERLKDQSRRDPENTTLLARMKEMGCLKPQWASIESWKEAVPITDDERAVIFLQVNCLSVEEIAKELNRDVREIRVIASSKRVQEKVEKERARKFGDGISKKMITRINQILPEAIETAYEIMMDKSAKASTRLAAADSFIDRALGKATQQIEVRDSTFKDLIEKIDSAARVEKEKLTIEMSKEENCEKTEEEGNKIDLWVAKNKL